MQYLWIALGTVAAAVAALPIAAIILVSLASLREESAHSLSGEAPGRGERLARQVLGFRTSGAGTHTTGTSITGTPTTGHTHRPSRRDGTEVRFAYARRPVSDPGQLPASSQSQQNRIRADQRQGAGV